MFDFKFCNRGIKRRLIWQLIFLIVTVVIVLIALVCCLLLDEEEIVLDLQPVDNDISNNEADYMYENTIALTFDDGPSKKTTTVLLDGLKERNVKATFFVVGQNASVNTELIERMHNEGHLIGNHTYSHVQLTSVNKNMAIQEIEKTNEVIKNITGNNVVYIRPPYGLYDNYYLEQVNMVPVLWSVDPQDWCCENPSCIVERVVNNVKNGDIILLHDIYDSSVAAALEIVDRLKEKGFVFVTVDQLILD